MHAASSLIGRSAANQVSTAITATDTRKIRRVCRFPTGSRVPETSRERGTSPLALVTTRLRRDAVPQRATCELHRAICSCSICTLARESEGTGEGGGNRRAMKHDCLVPEMALGENEFSGFRNLRSCFSCVARNTAGDRERERELLARRRDTLFRHNEGLPQLSRNTKYDGKAVTKSHLRDRRLPPSPCRFIRLKGG